MQRVTADRAVVVLRVADVRGEGQTAKEQHLTQAEPVSVEGTSEVDGHHTRNSARMPHLLRPQWCLC